MRPRLALVLVMAAASAILGLAAACSSTAEPAKLPLVEGGIKKDTADPFEEDAEVADTYIPPGTPGRVYAHTKDTLFLYEPVSGDLTQIGKFSCLDAADTNDVVIDLAVDRAGIVYGTTFRRFLKIDPKNAACIEIKKAAAGEDSFPNALSFVPAGTVDPTKEALVGYAPVGASPDSTDYVRIDTVTGTMTKIGQLNTTTTGTRYKSSGDLIALIQDSNRTFLTVKLLGDGGSGTDLLAEIDPKTGAMKRIVGDTKQTNLFGLGYWAGKGYGFSDNGTIAQIDMKTGSASVVKTAAPWYGAGVTTEAPITQ